MSTRDPPRVNSVNPDGRVLVMTSKNARSRLSTNPTTSRETSSSFFPRGRVGLGPPCFYAHRIAGGHRNYCDSRMLLPALSKANEQGDRAKCIGNMKQILLSTHLYVGDNDDYLPVCR